MSSDDEWTPQFEHIDWNDIVEAEQSGDAEALQDLRDKSMELKRSFSCPSPSTSMNCSPVQPQFKVPQKQPLRNTPSSSSNKRPFQKWEDRDYPDLPRRNTVHSLSYVTSPSGVSYAQAVQPRLTKRSVSERLCLSPVDCQPKRSALNEMVSTPTERGVEVRPTSVSTPQTTVITSVNEEFMEFTTPDTDSRPSKAVSAVQRRLFPTQTNENSSPRRPSSERKCEELTDHRLAQREKQINYGKNTLGYQRYIQSLPKWQRQRGDPMTPDKFKQCSTRAWQGQMKVWRRELHKYDPPNEEGLTQFTSEQAKLCALDLPDSMWEDY